ncbi:MAG: hypothetical protein FWF66_01195 [Candidatus Bathyarchaeota archaeon]|nr:hypothetical protein [Candidatus Termiticorpusculum sp.]
MPITPRTKFATDHFESSTGTSLGSTDTVTVGPIGAGEYVELKIQMA